jgi:hypothetical protein
VEQYLNGKDKVFGFFVGQTMKASQGKDAPFGSAKVTGDQHLTRLYEPYLQQLSKDVDWVYHRLETSEQLSKALQIPMFAKQQQVLSDSRPYFAVFTLILLGLVYFPRLSRTGEKNLLEENYKV